MALTVICNNCKPFKSSLKKCIQYCKRKIWMADVKLSSWNIATNAAIKRKKLQKIRNLIICAAKYWAKYTKLKHDSFCESNMNRLQLHLYHCYFFFFFSILLPLGIINLVLPHFIIIQIFMKLNIKGVIRTKGIFTAFFASLFCYQFHLRLGVKWIFWY